MAIKDVPSTFPVDFLILVNQFGSYLNAVVTKVAGPKPASGFIKGNIVTVSISFNASGDKANTGLISFWRTYIVPINTNITANDKGTFDVAFKDIGTWNNYFFILRTQLLGAIGNSNDPIIKAMDAVWADILLISGKWITTTKRAPK